MSVRSEDLAMTMKQAHMSTMQTMNEIEWLHQRVIFLLAITPFARPGLLTRRRSTTIPTEATAPH